MSEKEFSHLAVMAYEAAADPSLWPAFLKAYARVSSADVTLIQVHQFAQHRSDIQFEFGIASRFRDSYNEHYSRLNVWREHGQSQYLQGSVLFGEEAYPDKLLKASEFYNDYLRSVGGIVRSMAGVILRERDNALMLTTLRDERSRPWEASDKRIVTLLLPHLRRAFELQQKLSLFQAAESVMEDIAGAIVFFAADGRAIYANPVAENILRENDGLSMKSGRLVAAGSTQTAAILHAIRQAARLDVSSDCPNAFVIERRSLRRPYNVVIRPLRRRIPRFCGFPAPAAVALINDPEKQSRPSPQVTQKLYGLTPKEAELVSKLCIGTSVRKAAGEMGIQYETARTHLRSIYSKTGASRQNELIALLSRVANY